jgi:hypothetical protein
LEPPLTSLLNISGELMFASTRARRRTAVALGAAAVLAAGLVSFQVQGASARPDTAATAGTADTAGTAARHGAVHPYQDPSLPIPQRVADLLGRMSLAAKIGQMTQAERASVDSDADLHKISDDLLGSVLSGGGSVPTPNTPTAWADMVDRYQAQALQTPLQIPLIYGIDTVHGDGNMDGATVFPHNIGLGATRDPTLVRRWSTSPRPRPGRRDRSGRSRPASAWPATTAGAGSTSPSARPRGWSSRWRPRSTASRDHPDTSPTTTGSWPPPSTSPATA